MQTTDVADRRSPAPADVRNFFAAERTLLAWIRTGLSMMGFGFVVARFGLFLQEMAKVNHEIPPPRYGMSLWFGTALILAGVLVTVLSAVRYRHEILLLQQGQVLTFTPISLGFLLAIGLGLLGLVMACYLLVL